MSVNVVTGGAGFVGVNLIRLLISRRDRVLAIDDLSRGRAAYWEPFHSSDLFSSEVVDCVDLATFQRAVADYNASYRVTDVWHLAANSDIPAGIVDPVLDLERTFLTTFNTLLVMRDLQIPSLHFASSSAVYGDFGDRHIDEDIGPLHPISNYGAMKLASEAQIRAAVEAYLPRADVYRFPNVVGVPATHGVILDFVRRLRARPDVLEVLGDGTQKKAYLHVEDLVDAMLFIATAAPGSYNVLNVGPKDDGITVRMIAEAVRDRISPGASIRYGEGDRGWVGDVPKFRYSTARLAALGWASSTGSEGAIARAIEQIARQEELG